MTYDPDAAGPPEYQPDEDPGDDDAALFAGAAYELAGWEFIEQQQRETDPLMCVYCYGIDWTQPHRCEGGCACFCQVAQDG